MTFKVTQNILKSTSFPCKKQFYLKKQKQNKRKIYYFFFKT